MKKNLSLMMAAIAAIFWPRFGGATANAADPADKPKPDATEARLADLEKRLTAQAEEHQRQIAEMQQQHNQAIAEAGREIARAQSKGAEAEEKPLEEDTSTTLGLLAKGAGVPLSDVRWRVAAGLLPEQAVKAAADQKQHDADKAKREKEEQAAKAKAAKEAKP